MKTSGSDLKKVFSRVKAAHAQLQDMLKDKSWVDEARRFAERQGREAKKLFVGDLDRLKAFLERERGELERFQKQLPGEFEKFRKFVRKQSTVSNSKRGTSRRASKKA